MQDEGVVGIERVRREFAMTSEASIKFWMYEIIRCKGSVRHAEVSFGRGKLLQGGGSIRSWYPR